ncbi:MAG: DUF523 domain-containing protein, partial [Treponema sp.]|nr:DUF523 domain-containing protein [Treponema sp.]
MPSSLPWQNSENESGYTRTSFPRPPCEINNGKVIDKEGQDRTIAFISGAESCLAVAIAQQAELCILKEGSPS